MGVCAPLTASPVLPSVRAPRRPVKTASSGRPLADAPGGTERTEQVGRLRLLGRVAVIQHAADRLAVDGHQQLVDVPHRVVRHAEGRPVVAHVVRPRPQTRGADREAIRRPRRAAQALVVA